MNDSCLHPHTKPNVLPQYAISRYSKPIEASHKGLESPPPGPLLGAHFVYGEWEEWSVSGVLHHLQEPFLMEDALPLDTGKLGLPLSILDFPFLL